MNRVVCSRFDRKIPSASCLKKSLISLSFIRKKITQEYYCIATNGDEIFDGESYTLEDFFSKYAGSKKTLLVLTDKEVFSLARWCQHFDMRIFSFESLFPIFDDVKFTSNLKASFSGLKSRLAYARKVGLSHSSLASSLSSRIDKILARKLKYKTSYDEIFAHAYLPPYQEVFKFFDLREDRTIISLDFNSMFADCMSGEFLDPEKIYFEKIDATLSEPNELIQSGLYHVILKRPNSSFFHDFHPFVFSQLGLLLKFTSENTNEIEVQLFDFELDYYKRFFEEVHVLSALRSKSVLGHPLYSESRRLLKLRMRAKKNKNKVLERSYKFQLAMLHSATNRRAEREVKYSSFSGLISTLNDELHLSLEKDLPYLLKSSPLLKKVRLFKHHEENSALYNELNSSRSVYSFSSQVVAKSRLKMFQTLKALKSFGGLDICYVNTDSVHVSVPASRRQDFFKAYDSLIGKEIGKLKVQCVADKAVWFDVGHYFLFKDGEVVQWSSVGLNHKGNSHPFLNYREKYNRIKIDSGVALTKRKTTFMGSLSYKKRLLLDKIETSKVVEYQRFSVDDISGFDNAMLSILKEKRSSSPIKRELYESLCIKAKLETLKLS